jgi:hypothetical protein
MVRNISYSDKPTTPCPAAMRLLLLKFRPFVFVNWLAGCVARRGIAIGAIEPELRHGF